MFCTVEEEHGILTKNGRMFSLLHFHFQFKSANISTILTSKLETCVLLYWRQTNREIFCVTVCRNNVIYFQVIFLFS